MDLGSASSSFEFHEELPSASSLHITFNCLPLSHLTNNFMSIVKEFNDYRSKMNDCILAHDNKTIKRFWALDGGAYTDGAIPSRTKELLGLVASMVLRCDDCIKYHLGKCHEEGVSTEEVYEVFAIANLVGGSICIPHTRRAAEYWEILIEEQN